MFAVAPRPTHQPTQNRSLPSSCRCRCRSRSSTDRSCRAAELIEREQAQPVAEQDRETRIVSGLPAQPSQAERNGNDSQIGFGFAAAGKSRRQRWHHFLLPDRSKARIAPPIFGRSRAAAGRQGRGRRKIQFDSPVPRTSIVRVNSDGTLDPTLDTPGMAGALSDATPVDSQVQAVALLADGQIVPVGSYNVYDSSGAEGFCALHRAWDRRPRR